MNVLPRVVFAGTPEFAVPALTALIEKGFPIAAVYTQPDRPQGRGLQLSASPVKQLAEQHQLHIEQPVNFKSEEAIQTLSAFQPDFIIVVAYGLILPASVLAIPRFGCINIHPSLLPKYRGALPVQQALLNGDTETGVTIMGLDSGMDSGPVLLQVKHPILPDDTADELLKKLAHAGAELLCEAILQVQQGQIKAKPQDHTQASYTRKLSKSDAKLDWSLPAVVLERQIRAYNSWPIAFFNLGDQTVRVWRAEAIPQQHQVQPGTLLAIQREGLDIATGEGVLRLLELQLPGKKRQPIAHILNGYAHLFKLHSQVSE